jgi:hypothetical protein
MVCALTVPYEYFSGYSRTCLDVVKIHFGATAAQSLVLCGFQTRPGPELGR